MNYTKSYKENGANYQIVVKPALHYIKGNTAPYFSITATIYKASKTGERDRRYTEGISYGCNHDAILEHFPEMADIVALHLSDMNGAPMYSVENGFYFYQENVVKGFEYIRLPIDRRNVLIRDKADFLALVDSLKPIYKADADAVILKYSLVVTGDTWAGSIEK
jgi:hypothetical protein